MGITGDDSIDAALEADLTIDITTIGRRSGQPRRIEIWFLNVGGRIYITGTPGPRDWYANLTTNPEFMFHLKESTTADLVGVASPVSDPEVRRRVLSDMAAQWYRGQADLDDLVESAPLVEVALRLPE
jgi:deazaflavin-dependent oxidoreductase (nitroreductase family)